jgi:hypothetical protein
MFFMLFSPRPAQTLLLIGFFCLCLPSSMQAEEDENVSLERTEEGFVVKKGAYVDIPEDMKLQRVASNVIKPEPNEQYLARKFEKLEQSLTAQLDGVETNLEERLEKISAQLLTFH